MRQQTIPRINSQTDGCWYSMIEFMARGRVLAVDHEPQMLETLTKFFTACGYEVVTLENARDATTLLAVTPVDVVLLDVALPGTDGATALRRIRESHPNLPVIMVSGNPDLALARDTLECGAFDYVVKPFDFAHLAHVVAAAVARRG